MGPERMGNVIPIGRGHEIRQEKQMRFEEIIQPFLDAVAANNVNSMTQKTKENFVQDVARFVKILCLDPAAVNVPRKEIIEDLMQVSFGGVNWFREVDPQRSAVYATAAKALQEAVEVYQKNGGEIQFDLNPQLGKNIK